VQWIELANTALRYEVSGAGPETLVLVHEMGGTLDSWDHVLPALNADRRVLRYDTRGAGQSEKIAGTADIDAMADDIAALLDAAGITGKVAIAGCAVGGAIALNFTHRHPARVRALILMGPALSIPPDRREAALQAAASLEAGTMRDVVEASLARSYPPVVQYNADHYREFRARWLANDPRSYAAINRMLVGMDLNPLCAAIACPTLVMSGQHDPLRPPSVVEPVARAIPGARFVAIPSGHFMAVQTPDLVARTINDFLNAL
jgi:hypothetical protein